MDLETVLLHLQSETSKEIRSLYAPDCCIVASRVALDVLAHFQIPARPVVTRLFVMNQAYVTWVKAHQRLPTKEEKQEMLAAGGWSVLVGASKPTRSPTGGVGLPLHLVVYLDAGYLVDLSIGQASRPQKGIVLEPLIGRVSEAFPREGAAFGHPQPDGSKVYLDYEVIENDAYLQAPDWTSKRRRFLSGRAIMALNALDSKQQAGMVPVE
jgi:hypothetical protein